MLTRYFLLITVALVASASHATTGDALDRAGLTQTFADEFDTFSWFAEGDVAQKGGGTWRTNMGYRWTALDDVKNRTLIWNHEKQVYIDPGMRGTGDHALALSAIAARDGKLVITADTTDNPALYGYRYTSGIITSEPTFQQTYGVFEMRAKLPKGKGLWPAFWLLPADKSWPPEIDVMEMLGHAPNNYYTTVHSKAAGKHSKSAIPMHEVADTSAAFHSYAVEWGAEEIIFYFDDKEVGRTPTPPDLHKPTYMLINLAVGGDWPGDPDATTKFPAQMQVDWVRAWQRKP